MTGLRQSFQPEPVSSLHVTFIRKDHITGNHGFAARAGDNEMNVACAHDCVPALPSLQTVTVDRCAAPARSGPLTHRDMRINNCFLHALRA